MDTDLDLDAKKDKTSSYIMYLRSENTEIDMATMYRLQRDCNCYFSISDSWTRLITELGVFSRLSSETACPVVLIDSDLFTNSKVTAQEIVSMISTMHSCFLTPIKMRLGVVINQKCDITIIRSLHETDIIGIVPCATVFGYDKTLESLKEISAGRPYWPKELIDAIVGKISIVSKSTGITLTNRQQQVLSLVCNRGLSNKKIAQVLQISESTVKVHISAILKEYGVRNRTQLALAGSSNLRA